uniref:NADH dehydrogenase [ubiquinone] 1 beta subcomplex subunit 5, mitochondrial n=1 Tax=Ditylenchus dipsaci TaxID=166011 RepID=A0A915DDZ5_9BILA
MSVVSKLSGKFLPSLKSAQVIVCSVRGLRTSNLLSGGHAHLFTKRPGQLLHNRYKDQMHFYFVAIGVYPILLILFFTHVYYGSCELQDYPEDGTVPHYWQFERTPLRQWYAKWKHSILKRWRRMETRVKHLQGERWDYKGYYYRPISSSWVEYSKYRKDKTVAMNEYRGHIMGLTKDYLRFSPSAVCNVVGSSNGVVQCVDDVTCAVSACESVNFFNMRTLEKTYQIMAEKKTVTTFKLNKNKSLTAIGYDDGEVHLYRRSQEKDVVKFAGHRTGVNSLAFSDDGLVLASGGKDSMIILWDVVSEAGLFKLVGHKGSITQLQFTEDNKFLLSSSKDFQLKFWSMDSQSCFYTLAENVSEIYGFSLLRSDRLLVVGSAEPELLVFELSWLQFGCDVEISNRPGKIHWCRFFVEENNQSNIMLRCKKRGALIRQAKGRALQLCLSADNTILCCLGGDSLVDVYRVFTEEESVKRYHKKLRKEKKRSRDQQSEDISPLSEQNILKDVTLLITRIGDYRAPAKVKWMDFCKQVNSLGEPNLFEHRLYCLLNTNDVHGRRGHRSDVLSLSISSTGSSFVSGATESAILWDMDTLIPKNCFVHEPMKQVTSSLFSPGDTEIILCTKTGSIFLFNLASFELVEEIIHVHGEKSIWGSATLPDKSGFITCGSDKMARFWTYESVNDFGRKRLTVKFHQIKSSSFSVYWTTQLVSIIWIH